MAERRKSDSKPKIPRRPPATTPDARERQMIALAVDTAEQQMIDGVASAQVITHYLKLATQSEALEREKKRNENLLLEAKIQSINSGANVEKLYEDAIKAFRTYRGEEEEIYDP